MRHRTERTCPLSQDKVPWRQSRGWGSGACIPPRMTAAVGGKTAKYSCVSCALHNSKGTTPRGQAESGAIWSCVNRAAQGGVSGPTCRHMEMGVWLLGDEAHLSMSQVIVTEWPTEFPIMEYAYKLPGSLVKIRTAQQSPEIQNPQL